MHTFLLLGISYFIENRKAKYLILVVCACNFYPILYSYSRATYSATIVGFLTLGILKDRKFLGLVVVIVLLYSFILPTSVVERIDKTFLDETHMSEERIETSAVHVGGIELDTVGRKELWEKAIRYFQQEPIIGTGFDTFRHIEGKITHSLYMKILAEQGLLGMTVFLIFTLFVLHQSYKLFKYSQSKLGRGIGLGFIMCEITHLTGNISGDQTLYYHFMAIYWLFLGIVASFNLLYASRPKPVVQNGDLSKY
jgi:O-antigen ligase